MAGSRSPAFQFYASDFLVGVMGMTDEEVGVYIKMLAVQWVKGSLPMDPKQVKAVIGSRKPPSENVLAKFKECDDGRIRNARLEVERSKQDAFRESRASAAQKRWEKEAESDARALHVQCERDALQSSSSSSTSFSSSDPKEDTPKPPPADAMAAAEFMDAWNAADGCRKAGKWTESRNSALKTRLKDPEWREQWRKALAKFPLKLISGDPGGWRPDVDWFLRPDSVTRILEGKYDWSKNHEQRDRQPGVNYDPSAADATF